MNDSEFSTSILNGLARPSADGAVISIDDRRTKNAARFMTTLACSRLSHSGADEFAAGLETAAQVPFAMLRGESPDIRRRFNENWAGQQAGWGQRAWT